MTDDNVQQCMNKLDNLEKIDKFFKICNLLRQNHEQTENLNTAITSKEIELVVINSQQTIKKKTKIVLGFPGDSDSKESACSGGDLGFISGMRRFPWRRAWQHTPVFTPGESPWTEKPSWIQSMGSQRVRQD